MMMRSWTTTLALVGALAAPLACDAQDPDPSVETREVIFEADEVRAAVEQDPSTVFFVDLREPVTYVFDQPDEAVPLERFVVQCPSMATPLPMPDYLQLLGLDAELDGSYWSIRSAESSVFRSGPLQQDPDDGSSGSGCSVICPGGIDCALVCT